MKKVILTPEKRQELTTWMLENLLGKHCNPILQFLADNEEVTAQNTTDKPPRVVGGGGSGPQPPKP